MIVQNSCTQEKKNTINYLGFKYQNGFDPYIIAIDLIKLKNNTKVRIHTILFFDETEDIDGNYTKIDSSFTIENKRFDKLYKKVLHLHDIDFSNAFYEGCDGADYTIEYGHGLHGSRISYKFWSPVWDLKKRNLTYFLELCKEFLIIGNLNPKEIL